MLNTLVEKFRAAPLLQENQVLLAAALIRLGDAGNLQALFNAVHQAGGSGLNCAHTVGMCLALRDDGSLARMVAAYDAHCPFRGGLVAGLGYVRGLEYDLDGMVPLLRHGLGWIIQAQQQIPGERLDPASFSQLLKCAFLFEPTDWAGNGAAAAGAETLRQGSGDGAFTCVAAADSRYFVTYAEDFISGLQQHAAGLADPLLVIVDPDAEALAHAEMLAARHPQVTILTHVYGGGKLAEYCSGARFVLAGELLRRLGRPILFMDVDSHFRPGCGDVLARIARLPLCGLHRHLVPPYLISEAIVIGAHPGAEAEDFFADAGRFIVDKLAEEGPSWHVDQVALHRATALARRRGTGPIDLGTTLRGVVELPDYFKKEHEISFGTRLNGRSDLACDHGFSLAADGKPIFPMPPHS